MIADNQNASKMIHDRKSVTFLWSVPAPYREPLLEALSSCGERAITTVYARSCDPERPWTDVRDAASFFQLRREAQRSKHVIVPGWSDPRCLLAALASRCPPNKPILAVENWRIESQAIWRRVVRNAILRSSSALFAVGRRSLEFLDDWADQPAYLVHLNCADVDSIIGETGSVRRTPTPSLCYMGRFTKQKGLDILLEALLRIDPTFSVTVRLAGGRPSGVCYDAAQRVYRERPNVTLDWLGPIAGNRRFGLLASSWATVVPSRWETYGVIVHEALLAGSPVVSSDGVGSVDDFAVAELVPEGVVPSGSSEALAAALNSFLSRRPPSRDDTRDVGLGVNFRSVGLELDEALEHLDQR